MKRFAILVYLCSILIGLNCSEDKSKDAQDSQTLDQNVATAVSATLPKLSNDFLVSVYEKQEMIKISQDDPDLRKQYCDQAYLKEHQLFITMGIGSLRNPETGQSIPRHYAQRAATIDARRWASYGETWLKNNYQPAFGHLDTHFNRQVEIISENVVGDSLFVFMASSVVYP